MGVTKVITWEFLSQLYDKFGEFGECHVLFLGFSFLMFMMVGLNLLFIGTVFSSVVYVDQIIGAQNDSG